ncbi:MAG TPA: hypothetical protein VJ890_03350 [Vineibacter sp.]|nr:hypothetical protein [Vineibacter sp.]
MAKKKKSSPAGNRARRSSATRAKAKRAAKAPTVGKKSTAARAKGRTTKPVQQRSTRKPAPKPRPARRASVAPAPRAPQINWGAIVDSLNARVAARGAPVWETLSQQMTGTTHLPPPLMRARNIETSAPDGVRAYQYLTMTRACVADLQGDRPLAARENIARFLLHLGWHGSRLHYRLQGRRQMDDGDGAGRGLIPFEAHRAKDTLIHLARTPADRVARRLGDMAGLGWPGLVRAAHSLPDWGPGGRGAEFPEGHIVGGLLARDDQFNLYLARAAFMLLPPAVPIGNMNQAEYWFAYWRLSATDPDAERRGFAAAASEADALIDGA